MNSKTSTPLRLVRCPKCRKVLPEPPDVPIYSCGGCGAHLQAKKRKNDSVDAKPQKLEEISTGKQKMEQVSDDQKPSSSTNHSTDDLDRKASDHNDVDISSEHLGLDQDSAEKVENYTAEGVKEYIFGKRKIEPDVSTDEVPEGNNDPRSSTELSGHGDPESSPEATAHKRKDQDQVKEQKQDDDNDEDVTKNRSRSRSPEASVHDEIDKDREPVDRVFENSNNEVEFEGSSRELTTSSEKCSSTELNVISRKAIADTNVVRDFSNRGSNSSFKSLIAEKLLDTKQKKTVYIDEDEILSDDESADLRHRRRFNRISSEETLENARFGGGTSYEYEGSVSSFDGTDNQFSTKKQLDSGNNEFHQKHRRESHSSKFRRGKEEHHRPTTEFQPFYKNPIPSRHRPPAIPANAKLERLELLKMVRELQDQLERTNVSKSSQLAPPYYDHGLTHSARFGRRMAFSGETVAVNNRRDGSGMCHHCHPQERHFSAQLPRPHVCCNGPHYVSSTCYSSESDFSSQVVKPNPNEYRHRIDVPKPYNSPNKRYVRPISGGSPWITCYRCSEVLQLPQNFLVVKKRCHSLRCGACEKVLNFTVSDKTHVHRYYPEETMVAPPSSEVEEYGDARVGPVSCSDRSFPKSYSTETDRNGYWGFSEEKRKAVGMSRDPSGSSGPSSSRASGRRRVVSEIEEVEPANNGSPLHWLMGYASPSKVIRG